MKYFLNLYASLADGSPRMRVFTHPCAIPVLSCPGPDSAYNETTFAILVNPSPTTMKTSADELLKQVKSVAESTYYSAQVTKVLNRIAVPLLAILIILTGFLVVQSIQDARAAGRELEQISQNWDDIQTEAHNGEFSKALSAADKKLAKVPRDFNGRYIRGQIRLMNGDKAGAIEDFQAAYDVFPIYTYKAALDALKK